MCDGIIVYQLHMVYVFLFLLIKSYNYYLICIYVFLNMRFSIFFKCSKIKFNLLKLRFFLKITLLVLSILFSSKKRKKKKTFIAASWTISTESFIIKKYFISYLISLVYPACTMITSSVIHATYTYTIKHEIKYFFSNRWSKLK